MREVFDWTFENPYLTIFVLCLALMLVVFIFSNYPEVEKPKRKQWEYTYCNLESINDMGAEGWEAYGFQPNIHTPVLLKRELLPYEENNPAPPL